MTWSALMDITEMLITFRILQTLADSRHHVRVIPGWCNLMLKCAFLPNSKDSSAPLKQNAFPSQNLNLFTGDASDFYCSDFWSILNFGQITDIHTESCAFETMSPPYICTGTCRLKMMEGLTQTTNPPYFEIRWKYWTISYKGSKVRWTTCSVHLFTMYGYTKIHCYTYT